MPPEGRRAAAVGGFSHCKIPGMEWVVVGLVSVLVVGVLVVAVLAVLQQVLPKENDSGAERRRS